MATLLWEKKLYEVVQLQQRYGQSVLEMQRYYPDINKRVCAALPIVWEPNLELNVLNSLQKLNEVMQNSGCSLKEVVKTLQGNNNYKININWN